MNLSVIIPVYNERDYLPQVLLHVVAAIPDVPKEIVIVDDGSSDGTREWLAKQSWTRDECAAIRINTQGNLEFSPLTTSSEPRTTFVVILHEVNRGKGAAVRTGLAAASGDVLVIQDADLEYDPQDWATMWPLIAERKVADAVFGSRFYGLPHRSLNFHHYLANRLISFLFNCIYNQTLSDIEVCYKMFSRAVLESMKLTANDFGIEVELSAQITRRRWRIYEVAIRYFGRTYDQGKKINWRDGVLALWYLVRHRLRRI
jgi:glycosyltransferase involved in cell wall biosynthesis